MQRGALDCVLGAVAWLRTYGFIDTVKTFIEFNTGFARGMCIMCMNRDSWNSLTDDQKRLFWKLLPGVSARATITGYIKDDEKVKAMAQARGITFVPGGADLVARREAHRKSELKAIPAAMKKLGVRDPEKIMKAFFKNLAKWEKLSQGIGLDEAKLAAAYKREIYDRIDPTKW